MPAGKGGVYLKKNKIKIHNMNSSAVTSAGVGCTFIPLWSQGWGFLIFMRTHVFWSGPRFTGESSLSIQSAFLVIRWFMCKCFPRFMHISWMRPTGLYSRTNTGSKRNRKRNLDRVVRWTEVDSSMGKCNRNTTGKDNNQTSSAGGREKTTAACVYCFCLKIKFPACNTMVHLAFFVAYFKVPLQWKASHSNHITSFQLSYNEKA